MTFTAKKLPELLRETVDIADFRSWGKVQDEKASSEYLVTDCKAIVKD